MTMNLPPNVKPQDRVILFDGVCKLCHAWGNFIIENDSKRHFKLCSAQSKAGQKILAHFDLPTSDFESMLYVTGNVYFDKSDAFFEVIHTLGLPWSLPYPLRFLPKAIRDWLYDRIALNRYAWFGKYDYCRLPSADHDDRYLPEE